MEPLDRNVFAELAVEDDLLFLDSGVVLQLGNEYRVTLCGEKSGIRKNSYAANYTKGCITFGKGAVCA